MNKKLESLLKKREAIDAEIAHAKMIDQRCEDVKCMKEFEQILTLPDQILRASFARIILENAITN